MNKYAEWIEDMLGAIKESQDPTAICMIESCGKGCAARKNANTAMAELKSAASVAIGKVLILSPPFPPP